MKTKMANLRRPDILGNGDCSSNREILAARLNRWRQKLGYCSVFAAVPAILASHISEARSDEPKKPEASVAGRTTRLQNTPNKNLSSPALLKRQSGFLLPHQVGSFNMVAALSGNDDCPGSAIPGGNYTAAAPYIDSGDTTGANDTVSHLQYYYYYAFDTLGPDHVYSFTLTALGPNPEIEVTTTSGTYRPLIYVLDSRNSGSCPAGTGSTASSWWTFFDSRSTTGNTAKLGIDFLPLNTPLHLFVDSARNDASGSGAYKIRIQDATIAPAPACANSNPIDCTDVFVRQQYLDFLGREPDPAGQGWQNTLNNCPPSGKDVNGKFCDRIEVSAGFFRSEEFQGRGYYIYRFYSTVGRIPVYEEFTPDFAKVSGFLSDQQLEANKAAFVDEFMARADFQTKYSATFNNPIAYVDALLQTVGLPNHPSRTGWLNTLNSNNTSQTRAQVLRQLVESTEVHNKYYNEAFVIMQYFGYLRRTADAAYLDWIQTMNNTGSDYRIMINGFVNSLEYRRRFGP